MERISFTYKNQAGTVDGHEVINWKEVGRYIQGWCTHCSGFRTFRKDRVIDYLNGSETVLIDPYTPPPQHPKKSTQKPQIVFTGFSANDRQRLESIAINHGMDVRKTVTQNLEFICGGKNAGPSKLDKAREKRAFILSEDQFLALLDTGELPEHD